MFRKSLAVGVLCVVAAGLSSGCMKKMTVAEMKEKMPQRPAELDELNAFVGKWEFSGTATMPMLEEPLKSSGSNETKWDDSKWFTVTRGTFKMGELGDMTGVESWTYDTHSKKYRSTWIDSFGSVGIGEARHEKGSNTWKYKARSHGPWGESCMTGKVTFESPTKMTFEWEEYSGLMKTMEMEGTATRK
ncbi:MAG: hypothetical protein CHACPFDD_04030 [Phycisphaerae bacterium]|nr:hypothetical protein [Phycisphaerae bacterium]